MYVIKKAKLLANNEILLPNGKILGNRHFNKYYKQTDYYKDYIQIDKQQRDNLMALKYGSD